MKQSMYVMKTKILLIVTLFVLGFTSCEKIKDVVAVDVETELNAEIPVESTLEISLKSVKLAEGMYRINGIGSIELSNNNDVKKFIDGIRNIEINSPSSEITGLLPDDVIYSLQIQANISEINSVDQGFTLFNGSNITVENVFNNLDQVNDLINAWNNFNEPIFFVVSGKVNSDLGKRVKVNIKLPASVNYSPI